ncbi:hypothetical protein GCM10010350_60330 [Streptomyces galilaeus]|nr:hypothetical protein GCM10010350_60330 [Streptomyces galilaeus]
MGGDGTRAEGAGDGHRGGRGQGEKEPPERCDLDHGLPNAPPPGTFRPADAFAPGAVRLVPWTPIGDTTLDCVIICTRHSPTRERLCGGVA